MQIAERWILTRLLAKLARVDILVLDDLALVPLQTPSAGISSRSRRTGTGLGQRSSPARCPRVTGTRPLGIRPSRMRSATACFTTATGLCQNGPHDGAI